jgi:hypothetical protein
VSEGGEGALRVRTGGVFWAFLRKKWSKNGSIGEKIEKFGKIC